MEPARVLVVMASMSVVSGAFTIISVVIPHENERYDPAYLVVGAALTFFGIALRFRARRAPVTLTSVHVASFYISACVLALTWMGFIDVGGVQAVLLFIPLVISASLGPLRWTLALLFAQSLGYGIVLATADPVLGFDHRSQWVVVTMGLVVAVLYQDMMRRQLAAASAHEIIVDAEQATNRAAHARRLELVKAELQVANDLKGRFVAMASHELRTPLT
ncbi:MAG: hypothetical protein JWM90_3025, partial [Thermoleophilia bacterium]|nr:hypothetical protein [Thermoleophilia bacterium]